MSKTRLLQHFRNFYQLSRPINVLIAFITIWIAALISEQFYVNIRLVLAAFTAALMAAGANIINDIYDVEIDRINKPNRLLAAGIVTRETAWNYFYFAYGIAILLAVFSGWKMLIIAVVIGILLIAYSARLKRTILWGNIAVSLSSAVAFVYGAMAVGNWFGGIMPAVFAFFFHFGREIIKDMQDMTGDLLQNAITFPGKYGKKKSILLVNIIFISLIILTILPYIFSYYNILYAYIVIFGVDSVLLFVSAFLWQKHDQKVLGSLSHLLKLDMLVGLAAIYIGA